ncbi:hypothetical protein [Deinococcus reticulitermitis]|uniref:hypothetical protein n=1 Tax=Deinococcus reticulitermitis TaxID=856736 RepID=UPI001160DB5B|nr:hypothetical protein [Deinococcus reticulitermitis]
MATFEEVQRAREMMHRLHAETLRMVELLEAEPLWQIRKELSEPMYSQFAEVERTVEANMAALANNQAALAEAEGKQPDQNETLDEKSAREERWAREIASANKAGESGVTLRELLRQLINGLRSSRGAPPIPEGGSSSN